MEQVIKKKYGDFKQQLDTELQKQAEGFVKVGYLLKVARDTEVLRESGYNTVAEFALAEYGMSKDVVSRYIAINDKYSVDGYSEELKGEYKAYGYAKLTEMLTLPNVVADAIGPEMTRGQIREVKREIAEEEKVSDLEVMMEEQDPAQEVLGSNLKKHMHQYFHDNPEQYVRLFGEIPNHKWTLKETHESIRDILAPSGIAMLAARVAGVGRLLLSIKDIDTDVELINVRSGEKESYTWTGLAVAISDLQPTTESGGKAWEYLYREVFPEKKQEVAPAQPNKPIPQKKTEKQVEKPAEQIPGQDSVMNHQELLLEGMEAETPEAKEEPREPEKVAGEVVEDQGEKTRKKCAKTINAIEWNINTGNYKKAYEATEELLQCLKKLI